jgi:hypothetical protein
MYEYRMTFNFLLEHFFLRHDLRVPESLAIIDELQGQNLLFGIFELTTIELVYVSPLGLFGRCTSRDSFSRSLYCRKCTSGQARRIRLLRLDTMQRRLTFQRFKHASSVKTDWLNLGTVGPGTENNVKRVRGRRCPRTVPRDERDLQLSKVVVKTVSGRFTYGPYFYDRYR